MKSSDPKVIQPICGRPLIHQLLETLHRAIPDADVAVIVGHGREKVEAVCKETDFGKKGRLTFILQDQQLGTGHAARCAMDAQWGEAQVKKKANILVMAGDSPLLTEELFKESSLPLSKGAALRLVSTILDHPTGYGRIVRKGKGAKAAIQKIVEEKDAGPKEKAIREVGMSFYLFEAAFLQKSLRGLKTANAQKEYYLTDVVTAAVKAKKKIDSLVWSNADDLLGINDFWELAAADRILMQRILKTHAKNGVRIIDPTRTRIEPTVQVSDGTVIHPGASLEGKTTIGRGTVIGAGVILKNVQVGEGCDVRTGTVGQDSVIENQVVLGPYANLRPGSHVGESAKIGNFVELKQTRIGKKTSVAHLSYLGDAEVGDRVNIGCGFVTCNFDGRVIDGSRKHKTVIGDDVFMGSDCQTIAPIKIGAGAYVASGSTLSEDVESEALAIARSRQVNKPGYAKKLKGPGN
ncbi:MAG: bifunctional UDP-N-acetylglucosamine diphosphorylase/glucosamine-1-phosphate N-acetyltransferase GlmU [Bdellovibrionales bacterium]|nr:bifunctional UDP-N-acetylglucosamine diphosphorylase/glucosamine-1-phosphate N-acetyltransferase GlmU [Bdellovibrionales bacterium]